MSPVPDSPSLRSRLTPALFPTRPPVLNTRVPNTPQLQPTRLTFSTPPQPLPPLHPPPPPLEGPGSNLRSIQAEPSQPSTLNLEP